jgi:hypothetical protein
MPGEFATTVRPAVETQLDAGESLQGLIAATQQKTFSGQLYVIAVTDRRLLLVPLDRWLQPKGDAHSIAAESLASADVDGAGGGGGGWWSAPAALLDATALTLRIQTTGGEKFKLRMMKGTGVLGGLGGGQAQSDGILALAEWMRRNLGDRTA